MYSVILGFCIPSCTHKAVLNYLDKRNIGRTSGILQCRSEARTKIYSHPVAILSYMCAFPPSLPSLDTIKEQTYPMHPLDAYDTLYYHISLQLLLLFHLVPHRKGKCTVCRSWASVYTHVNNIFPIACSTKCTVCTEMGGKEGNLFPWWNILTVLHCTTLYMQCFMEMFDRKHTQRGDCLIKQGVWL